MNQSLGNFLCNQAQTVPLKSLIDQVKAMARYYFHVINGEFIPDFEGIDCKSAEDAKAEAVKIAGAMIEDQGVKFWKTARYDMFVCDENQRTRLKLSFTAEDLTGDVK